MSNREQIVAACHNLAKRLEQKHALLEPHLPNNHDLQVLYADSKSFLVMLVALAEEAQDDDYGKQVDSVVTVLTSGEAIDETLANLIDTLPATRSRSND